MVGKNSYELPPGFRFHPTDEELIMFYLRNQVKSGPCPISVIPEVDIYKFDPWELPAWFDSDKTRIGENEWYFFSPRERKYPNGVRPNRAAVSGYWKATGTDKAILSGSKYVGVKKALVFYKGRPPKGIKTDWIMHEYRLSDQSKSQIPCNNKQHNGSMRLDDWVLCRIYKKKSVVRSCEQQHEHRVVTDSYAHQVEAATSDHQISDAQEFKFPRTCSLTHLWEFGYNMGSISQLFMNDNNSYNVPFNNYQENTPCNIDDKSQLGQVVMQQPCTEAAVKFEVNPVYHLQ